MNAIVPPSIRQGARRVVNRLLPRTVILAYHRVAELSSDPQLLAVTPEHFAAQMEVLRKHFCPVPLRQIDTFRRGAVIVTFDDGYADNLWNAKPLLERYDVPATVFVASGSVGEERTFWWDDLETLLLERTSLPRTVELKIEGSVASYDLGASADYDDDAYQCHRSWNVLQYSDPTARQFLYRSLHELLRSLRECQRREILDQLRGVARAPERHRPGARGLSPGELIELHKDGLIEVGAHTVTHPVLSALPPAVQQAEIERSKAELQEILGAAITSFAYPYGTRADYTEATVALVRGAGYHRACSNFAGFAGPATDRYQLPRFLVRDWDGDEFKRQMDQWLHG